MNAKVRVLLVVLLLGTALAGCNGGISNQNLGLIGGAAVGGLVGSAVTGNSVAGTVVGAAAGGLIGSQVGKNVQ